MTAAREIRLKSRPSGLPTADNFELATVDLPAPGEGEVQVKNLWMTVDPYMRGRMNDVKSYSPPFALGKVMDGGAIGEVTASNSPNLKVGDLVQSGFGWREGFNAAGDKLQKLDPRGLPPQTFLGAAGMPGVTAYAGLLRVAALKDGDVVFVSGAAGAVGSMVAQIAKAKGHTVIGSAGGADKVAFLKEIGVDHVIDYKVEKDLTGALAAAAPGGIDVYFDNVGGAHLEAALNSANMFARFAICGMISIYNATKPEPGPSNLAQLIGKNIRMEGFIVSHHFDLMPKYIEELSGWVKAGKVTWKETVFEGLEKAPEAFIGLFSGENLGKMLVKLG
ncbi:MAG: NADP-dependent oxidoreductase [Alphaproteobacteria bacterium]|nr:NADP-dependent oxidoreductase [Alphaproteobacteria bacterium]MBU1513944.1 NADP-dependent oxidoreductase [Alphaproteobacteria bacterium]MBU2092624.1 NADP-dependent oxidoreductase [Alphaproteobacteria bacterium]MBU2154255.1 NADP-dependent oxidoreductase [Alphaproteobacteria bacterium]MBU2309499.1 NADP-dependent oxidoreductase [Alphaproteobacteria bacterium]